MTSAIAHSSDPTLLIVDDSRYSRVSMRSYVQASRPGWHIIEAASGAEALEAVEKENISLFSIDVNMPYMDGFELIEKLRANDEAGEMVLLTGDLQQKTQERATELGVRFVHKPVTAETAAELVELLSC